MSRVFWRQKTIAFDVVSLWEMNGATRHSRQGASINTDTLSGHIGTSSRFNAKRCLYVLPSFSSFLPPTKEEVHVFARVRLSVCL